MKVGFIAPRLSNHQPLSKLRHGQSRAIKGVGDHGLTKQNSDLVFGHTEKSIGDNKGHKIDFICYICTACSVVCSYLVGETSISVVLRE